jgi:HAMP domain-containing protein
VIEARNGSRFGIGWENALLAGGARVSVVKMQPYETLVAGASTIRDSTLLGGLAAVLGAIVLAVFLARSLTRQLGQMTLAVEGLGRDQSIAVPTGATGEIGTLARAFERTSLDLILITDTYGKFVRVIQAQRRYWATVPTK